MAKHGGNLKENWSPTGQWGSLPFVVHLGTKLDTVASSNHASSGCSFGCLDPELFPFLLSLN